MMKIFTKKLTTALLCLSSLPVVTPLMALENGQKWSSSTFTMHIKALDLHGTKMLDAMEDAVARWNDTATSFKLLTSREEAATACHSSYGAKHFAVFSKVNCDYPWGTGVLAVSKSMHSIGSPYNYFVHNSILFNDHRTWEIYDGDMRRTGIDIKRVAVHELGHSMGLAHSGDGDAIMYPSAGSIYLPADDDINTLKNLYGTTTHKLTLINTGNGVLTGKPTQDGTMVSINGGGNTTQYGTAFNCSQPQCIINVQDGLRLTLTAAAGSGDSFIQWDGAAPSRNVTVDLPLMSGNTTITANFSGTTPVPNQAPTANAGVDKTVTQGQSVTLNGSGSGDDNGITSYQWRENGQLLSSRSSFTISTLSVGVHNIVLTVKDASNESDTDTVRVTVSSEATTTPTTTPPASGTTKKVVDVSGAFSIPANLFLLMLIFIRLRLKSTRNPD